jgi:Uma2 family endonuclease
VATTSELSPQAPSRALDPEERFVLYGVPWATYVVLRDTLDDHSGLRMTYLEGTLELMSPSGDHEDYKKMIARLLEAWAEESDVPLNGRGGQTFRREAKQRGLEPDECYAVGPFGDVPQIAIEVVISSDLVDKLDVYCGLGVAEVWVWRAGKLRVHVLRSGRYEERGRSEILPALDVDLLASFVSVGADQTAAVKAYRVSLRAKAPGAR